MYITKKISEFYDLIKSFELNEDLQQWQNEIFENIVTKLTITTKNKLLENIFITIYVNNLKDCEQNIHKSNIVQFKDPLYIYLIKILIESKSDFKKSENEMSIRLFEYDKEKVETVNIINSLIYLIYFTDTQQSLSINTKKIDSLYTGEFTKFAKKVNKSIVTTLTGKRKNDKFIIYPKCKKNYIPIEEISKKYLSIGNKNINIACPICNENFNIDKSNIEKKFKIQDNNSIQFNCKHTGSNKHLGKNPFIFNLKSNLINTYKDTSKKIEFSKIEKIMFLINNFEHLKLKIEN